VNLRAPTWGQSRGALREQSSTGHEADGAGRKNEDGSGRAGAASRRPFLFPRQGPQRIRGRPTRRPSKRRTNSTSSFRTHRETKFIMFDPATLESAVSPGPVRCANKNERRPLVRRSLTTWRHPAGTRRLAVFQGEILQEHQNYDLAGRSKGSADNPPPPRSPRA